jgi:FtsP/CotA-like multicopper oxidase with cupredoxin domain
MERRRFLKLGAVAGATAALSPSLALAQQSSFQDHFELSIEPVDYEMINGEIVYMVFFFEGEDTPHPVLRALEGETIEIKVVNHDTVPHGFGITGIPSATIASIPPNDFRIVRFAAPFGGSYLYHDPSNAPLNRLLGLYGCFAVAPRLGTTLAGSPTPFSRERLTPEVASFFDSLGRIRRFPGNQWDPNDPERDKVWVIAEVDPVLNERVSRGEQIAGNTVRAIYFPRFFHINAVSGFDAADHANLPPDKRAAGKAIEPEGRQGQPTLLRTMNAGLATHALHIHGNSVFDLTKDDGAGNLSCETNVFEVDVWRMPPLARKDMLLPFERPPDIPLAKWPPKEEPFPLRYVMHCHTEMSQTAGGGNYPQGLVTHWEMTAPL